MNIQEISQGKKVDVQKMIEFYDQLDGVDCSFMYGRWKGFEVVTGHPMNGLLELASWYGKLFIDQETVYPLVISMRRKQHYFSLIRNGCL